MVGNSEESMAKGVGNEDDGGCEEENLMGRGLKYPSVAARSETSPK